MYSRNHFPKAPARSWHIVFLFAFYKSFTWIVNLLHVVDVLVCTVSHTSAQPLRACQKCSTTQDNIQRYHTGTSTKICYFVYMIDNKENYEERHAVLSVCEYKILGASSEKVKQFRKLGFFECRRFANRVFLV